MAKHAISGRDGSCKGRAKMHATFPIGFPVG